MSSSILLNKSSRVCFIHDPGCLSGVVRIAGKVIKDMFLALGISAESSDSLASSKGQDLTVVYGVAGMSPFAEKLLSDAGEPIPDIKGKREVYSFKVIPGSRALVILGSDKRGAVYGLFRLSELMGVSPFVNWSLCCPKKLDSFILSDKETMISKEPSVRYRGFFINDEWPAFGTWCQKHFGGINAAMYEGVFELLLRLKGNYLWPAMWASCFSCDGPDLKSAELADELGIVMGLSHHEPCLRHGEEYSKLRGKDSIYGDAWDFRRNREGITRFWRDGLKRSGRFENVITVGMRGEADSAILGKDATLKDNIDLLRDVLKTQKQLITEEVSRDIGSVPRMLALYKEVEPYYYGSSTVEGLKNDPSLDGVILMLCDDNHGYLRSLPDEEMLSHKGGFGMYYHFDYHGAPVSYEWINSTYLPEVCEQMSTCYENGVRELWIVNVGDLALQEFPLSYFLDLAYDYDKWSAGSGDAPERYTRLWMERQFGGGLPESEIDALSAMFTESSRLIHNRRPEHMSRDVYSFGEALRLKERAESIINTCTELEARLPEELRPAFTELISYNVCGGMELLKLWASADLGHRFAQMGAVCANSYANEVEACIARDGELREKLHTAAGGKWDGFGLAEHIGFRYWNSEESTYPVIERVIPSCRDELIVGVCADGSYTRGLDWTRKTLIADRFEKKGGKRSAGLFAALTGRKPVGYSLSCDAGWLTLSRSEGELSPENDLEYITITVSDELPADINEAEIVFRYPRGRAVIKVICRAEGNEDSRCYAEENGLICIKAEHFASKADNGAFELRVLPELGRAEGGLRLFPLNETPRGVANAPNADYTFVSDKGGSYELIFQLQPNSPYTFGSNINLCYELNGEKSELAVLSDSYASGVTRDWEEGVLSHARYARAKVSLRAGANTLRFYGTSREAIPERIILVKEGRELPGDYLGIPESVSYRG